MIDVDLSRNHIPTQPLHATVLQESYRLSVIHSQRVVHAPDIFVGSVVFDQCFLRLQRLGVINFELARARDHRQVVSGRQLARMVQRFGEDGQGSLHLECAGGALLDCHCGSGHEVQQNDDVGQDECCCSSS